MSYANITIDAVNGTAFQQVQVISQTPYYTYGFVGFAILLLFVTFLIGFSKVTRNNRSKMCFRSSVYWRVFSVEVVLLALGLVYFYFPFHLMWFGG